MNNFLTRTVTGAVFVALVVTSIIFGAIYFSVLFYIFSLIGLHEFFRLLKLQSSTQKYLGFIIASVVYVSLALVSVFDMSDRILLINIPFLFLPFIVELFNKHEAPFQQIGYLLLGILYITLPFALLQFFFLFEQPTGVLSILLSYFIIIWVYDTFAYLVGKQFGKHRMFERISPLKSWEGFIGGAFFALLTSWIFSIYHTGITSLQWIILGCIIVVFSTLGDLIESLFKRSMQVKDAGSILPGHGGVLDRFDSVLISAPIVFSYLILINYL